MTKDEIILAQQARIEQLKAAIADLIQKVKLADDHLSKGDKLKALTGVRRAEIAASVANNVLRRKDDLSALRAHDAALLAPYQWQPIETAPKDGTEVILWFPFKDIAINGLYGEVSEGEWETGYRKWMEWLVADELWFQEDPSQAPTHWMPLPSAEAIEKGGA